MSEQMKANRGPESGPAHRYTAALAGRIEARWQAEWERVEAFRAPNPGEEGFDPSKPKRYVLDMFPYPSGAGLHVGHPEGYTATDIYCRYSRMRGFSVLHPMGWDAFGLPAEQYAVQTNVHPAETTRRAIETFRRQLKRFGFSYDWSREFATIDPEYYRWTQWIWLRLYHAWCDPRANGGRGAARPIETLLEALAGEELLVAPDGSLVEAGDADRLSAITGGSTPGVLRAWASLEARERREVVEAQRLAYLGEQTVNWCPKLGTVLANEEVIDGRSERGGHAVKRVALRQWMFRITAFADRLLDDLRLVDWPESTRTQQAEWIGRSEGAEVEFRVVGSEHRFEVFTTRPDTLFGATYCVLAPEHPLVAEITSPAQRGAVEAYVREAASRTDVERQESKTKTGVPTGAMAMNPATGAPVPVWVADYVLMGYGTGAIMAVPAHDQRDFEFARAMGLPIVDVAHTPGLAAAARASAALDPAMGGEEAAARLEGAIAEPDRAALRGLIEAVREGGARAAMDAAADHRLCALLGRAVSEPGVAVNSSNAEVSLNGLATAGAKARMIGWIESSGAGRARVNYKLRDWLFSRQRYWGEPFPVAFDEAGAAHTLPADALPVELPEVEDFRPVESDTPQPPLAKARDWLEVEIDGVRCVRETNTMPNWAGSCWYYLRYCDARNGERFVGREAERYWMGEGDGGGVDLYIGGAEHAVLHLLYARFWHKALYDLGEVSTPEPFRRLFHQGLILSHAYERPDGSLVPVDEVEERGEGVFVETATGERVRQIVAKMSKSLRNVVNPDEVIEEYGADTFRLYEMYMGPLEAAKPWNTRDIVGLFRFLQRAWRLAIDEETGGLRLADRADEGVERTLHRTIKRVGDDIERLAFNTAIAAMIEFVNEATRSGALTEGQLSRFVRTLCPFAPHLSEEVWSRMGGEGLASLAPWPGYDEAMLVEESVELAVQIMGKVKGRITAPADADAKAVEAIALADDRIRAQLEGLTVRKVIVVPGRLVNIVAS